MRLSSAARVLLPALLLLHRYTPRVRGKPLASGHGTAPVAPAAFPISAPPHPTALHPIPPHPIPAARIACRLYPVPPPQEREIIQLYRTLYSYSVGFFAEVGGLMDGAEARLRAGAGAGGGRQPLLELVFRAYAQLWDEALMVGGWAAGCVGACVCVHVATFVLLCVWLVGAGAVVGG